MASIIDPEHAKRLIREFQQQNASEGGPALKTPGGLNLNGFFIDRESLETILSNKNVTGISVHLAKDPAFAGKPDNVITLAYTGAEPNTAPDATTPHINNGDIYCGTPPCPPWCSKIG